MPQKTTIKTSFPFTVNSMENTWITLSDGTRLAARIWMPDNADSQPVPAILEYIPYRKRDLTRKRDTEMHHYFAGHGYAAVRVDLRGSGDSEGVLTDEYLEQELQDGEEVLTWIATQQWCDGNVGIIGKSWGGFNGLQLAYRQPPELKAVITVCSTDDRYADDVHYMGGCLLGDNLSWASVMFSLNSLPPDPKIAGEKWRDMWFDRLKGSGLWLNKWLEHQHLDEYWEHGSVNQDFSKIKCPVFAVSGWADGYSNAVFRLIENLPGPKKGMIGPWSHKYPHSGEPGPAIGFLQEALRWWDCWLKGIDNGIMKEPVLRTWMQDAVAPYSEYRERPGRWIVENEWPSEQVRYNWHQLSPWQIMPAGEDTPAKNMFIKSPLSVGLFAGKWCSYSAPPDLPHDQREEDGGALIFDSEKIDETFEIHGAPVVDLTFSVDKPVAMVAVRLSTINPDHKITRVTYGLLNLCHRNSHKNPELLVPDKEYTVKVQLNDVAQVFPKGHKFRLSISTSYFPLAWPAPEPAELKIIAGKTKLGLPIRTPSPDDKKIRKYDQPETAPPLQTTVLKAGNSQWWVKRDLAKDKSMLEVVKDEGVYNIDEIDLQVKDITKEWYQYEYDNFNSLRGEVYSTIRLKRHEWEVTTYTRTVLKSDHTNFYVYASLDAYQGDKRVFSKTWDKTIPRKLV